MDERLIAADPRQVKQRMAQAYLAGPAITAEQGAIRLAPHQVDAASRLLAMLDEWGGAVLADATGLGKTFVAIAVARVIQPALVVAPAALRRMWRDSLGRAGVAASLASYEALSRGEVRDAGPALLVLDEAHHARNPRAKRYAALADLAWGARVLLLTATPIHNCSRDLRALVALFIGSRADTIREDDLRRLVVRRVSGSWSASSIRPATSLPTIREPHWLSVPRDPDTLRTIRELPPALPASDGGAAHALLVLGLIRAWASSEAALRQSLRRRLRRAASFAAALDSGCIPDRRELESWPVVDDAVQLGFPELMRPNGGVDVAALRAVLDRHTLGCRSILGTLDRNGNSADDERIRLLTAIRERHRSIPTVAFTQFADTASATFRAVVHRGGVALATGSGARIATGRITVDEIVRGFDTVERGSAMTAAMPLELLIATDVLSEGLSLRRAGVIVHLDLPWTLARLEQRVGRLRRLGSRHQQIIVYAIGPPVESRELIPVVRALQRKARLTSSVVGPEELESAFPLFGERLRRATREAVCRNDSSATESLRTLLTAWASGTSPVQENHGPPGSACLALLSESGRSRLIAVNEQGVSENTADVLQVVKRFSRRAADRYAASDTLSCGVGVFLDSIDKWLDEQRATELARPATDAPSAAHAAILHALQDILANATRATRPALTVRVERCRQLVIAARGIGAEFALARMIEPNSRLDLDALEQLLESRAVLDAKREATPILSALLCEDPEQAGAVSAFWKTY